LVRGRIISGRIDRIGHEGCGKKLLEFSEKLREYNGVIGARGIGRRKGRGRNGFGWRRL
jgi:hypothetical protein